MQYDPTDLQKLYINKYIKQTFEGAKAIHARTCEILWAKKVNQQFEQNFNETQQTNAISTLIFL